MPTLLLDYCSNELRSQGNWQVTILRLEFGSGDLNHVEEAWGKGESIVQKKIVKNGNQSSSQNIEEIFKFLAIEVTNLRLRSNGISDLDFL